jgi:uncharacterized protein
MSSVPPGNDGGAAGARSVDSVTVSITRRVQSTRIAEAAHWAQQGMDLASAFPGFLGSGWVRASADSLSWHMLYRFGNSDYLDAWEGSPERAEWLARGVDFIVDARVEKRTGIEGWFDAPQGEDGGGPGFQPPAWKQTVAIGLGFFPSNLVFTLLATLVYPGWGDVPLLPRLVVTTCVMAPAMTLLVMPYITRWLRPWLTRPPASAYRHPHV